MPSTTETPATSTQIQQPENVTKSNNIGTMVGIGIGASLGSVFLTVAGCYIYTKKLNRQSSVLRVP